MILRESVKRSRELIASELWPFYTTSQSRAYLRKALWQLRNWLDGIHGHHSNIIRQDGDALFVNPDISIQTDTNEIYAASRKFEGIDGRELTDAELHQLERAVSMYEGDLLENWYEYWIENCRDSYRMRQFVLLDKIIDCCLANRYFDKGLQYCSRVLCLDAAREKTHRAKMRFYFESGNRVDALRQYERCRRILSHEFDIKPSRETEELRGVIAGTLEGQVRMLTRSGT